MLFISQAGFSFIFLILLYAPVSLVCLKWLIPRLSSIGKRITLALLLTQLAVIFIALTIEPASDFEARLWAFHSVDANDSEWNIPATLAATQLALVGGMCLLNARFAATIPLRLYMAANGVVFLLFAVDEYFVLHESLAGWQLYYSLLGIALASATVFVALRSPRSAWKWHACYLTGLAMSAVGAIVFDVFPQTCDSAAFLRFDGCLEFSFQEESLEYLGIWLTLVAMLGHFSAAMPDPSAKLRRFVYAMPALWLLLLTLNALLPRVELRFVDKPASIHFASGISLLGYAIDSSDSHVNARIYATATQADYMGLGYSLHLVDIESGESIAGEDTWADRQHGIWLLGPEFAPVYRQTIGIQIPPDTAKNRAFSVVLSLWRRSRAGFQSQTIRESDLPLLSETQVILGEMALKAESVAASSEPLAVFANGFALQSADLPRQARAGESLPIQFIWRSAVDETQEYGQFLHLGHAESGEWFVYDQPPLGDRLPTRLWYTGLVDSETWTVPLSADLAPGEYSVFTGLYRADDKERLPVTDADGAAWQDMRVALGGIEIEA